MSIENIPEINDKIEIIEYLNDTYKFFYHGLKAAKKYNFSVGDILIKNYMQTDENGQQKLIPFKISNTNKAPKKFKVVAIDEFGIPWIRQINSSTGALGAGLETIASFDPNSIHFTPDREQAESILMGDEEGYNPLAAAKERRKRIVAMRKRNGAKLFTSSLSSQWADKLKNLKRSQELWFATNKRYMGDNATYFCDAKSLDRTKIRVMNVNVITLKKDLKEYKDYLNYRHLEEASKMIGNGEEVVIVKYITKDYWGNWNKGSDANYMHNVSSGEDYYDDIEKYAMYLEEPEVDETK